MRIALALLLLSVSVSLAACPTCGPACQCSPCTCDAKSWAAGCAATSTVALPDLRKGNPLDLIPWPRNGPIGSAAFIGVDGKTYYWGDGFVYDPTWKDPFVNKSLGPQPDGRFLLAAGDPSEPLPAEWQDSRPEMQEYDRHYRAGARAFKAAGLVGKARGIPHIHPLIIWRHDEADRAHNREAGNERYVGDVKENMDPQPPPAKFATETDWEAYRKQKTLAPAQYAKGAAVWKKNDERLERMARETGRPILPKRR